MWAKNENGQIKVFGSLPSKYKSDSVNCAGGFDKMPVTTHEQEGFYPLITPSISETEKLGGLYFDEENKVFTYKVEKKTDMDNWDHPECAKRIIAPAALVMEDIGVKMLGWFQVMEYPIVRKGNNVHLYCNQILPQHQAVVDSLQGVITIEERPEE